MKVSEFQDRLQKFSTSTGTSSSWRFLNKVVNTLVQTAAGTDDTSLPSIPSTTPSQKPSLPPTHQSSYSTPILNSNKPKDPLPPSVPTSKDDTAKPKLESKSSNLNFNPFDPPDTPSSPQTSKLNSAKSVPLKQENTNTDTKKSESGSPSNNKPQDNKSGLFKWIGGLIKIPNRPKQVNLGSNDEYTWHPGHQLFIPPVAISLIFLFFTHNFSNLFTCFREKIQMNTQLVLNRNLLHRLLHLLRPQLNLRVHQLLHLLLQLLQLDQLIC